MKQVYMAHDLTEAHFVKGPLDSRGVSAALRGEDVAGIGGEVPFMDVYPTVWVLDDDQEEDARAIVQEYESGTFMPGQGAGWKCPKCGQQLEAQFTACWACGTEGPR